MSYDLAVWEGDQPADHAAADQEYRRLYDRYIDTDDEHPPAPRIAAYVRALLDRYPDITSDDGQDSPWSDGPLINDASGPFFYFAMVWSQCEEASAWAAQLAHDHGLVCFDPQMEQLRPLHARHHRVQQRSRATYPNDR